MVALRFVLALAACAVIWGAEKKPAEGRASNDAIEITAKAYLNRQAIKKLIGSELDDSIKVIEVRLVPKAGSKLVAARDDFMLRSFKDGQRSTPFAPSQIAGPSVMEITPTGALAPLGQGAQARAEDAALLVVLRAKVLPEKETTGPVSGLLYFPLEGKQKPKDLELSYNGAAGKLSLRFKE